MPGAKRIKDPEHGRAWLVVITIALLFGVAITIVRFAHEYISTAGDFPPEHSELTAYIIASSDCGWSTRPALMETVGSLRQAIRDAHGNEFARITIHGVITDRDLGNAAEFAAILNSYHATGLFDELSLGGSWLNENLVRLIGQTDLLDPMVPQIVLTTSPVISKADHSASESLRVLLKLMGSNNITNWVAAGLPLEGVRPLPVT